MDDSLSLASEQLGLPQPVRRSSYQLKSSIIDA